ncbi:biotin--[acetyl-CoA-carboxylase] ligase [Candidatus Izimaplasma bacterium ZiA1]|uniref:biotin--[acetyl-CoA-carboxylase] ligase n=1 Tax=Candidatus Izimoplasma sp. ZiA1 TaxID=2024899 RepID=UPI000BAA5E12|nr:biotin--[acetyl-CoA-carboxylase] ligase [Candidatus Izimaplasma bacterium ZiA1]
MFEKNLIKFDIIDSTNKYLKQNVSSLKSGTVVDAKSQTNGYGRKNRIWFDNGVNNLSFSVLLKLPIKNDLPVLTQAVAAAITNTLDLLGLYAEIKWPNDIIISGKKVAGILLETIINDDIANVIIGVGLNVNSTMFNDEIKHIATSLLIESNQKHNLDYLRDIIVNNIFSNVLKYMNDDYSFLDICRKRSFLIGKKVFLDGDTSKEALVSGIDQLGRLVVLINNKEEKFYGSEVSLKGVYSQGEK